MPHSTIYRITFVVVSMLILFLVGIYLLQDKQKEQIKYLSDEGRSRTEILLKKNLELLSQNQISYTFDYTYWDDMVLFVKDPDSKWAERNIISSIKTYKLNCAWVLNKSFEQTFSYNDLDKKEYVQFPFRPEVVKEIFSKQKFPHFFVKSGTELLELTGAPIQFSNDDNREGIPQGYYITARIWNSAYLNEIHKINNSDIFLSTPGKNLESETTSLNTNRPEIIIAKTPLLDYSGKIVSYLTSRHTDKGIEGMLEANQRQLPLFIILGSGFLLAIALSLIFWVVIPLSTISKSLKVGATENLKELSTKKTEFGSLASLLVKFFRQKEILESEVTIRENIEKELLEIKKNLEVQVENRTHNLTELNKKLIGEQEQTKMYFDSSGSIICLLNKNGNIKLVNKYGCNLLYYSESEIIGKNCFLDLLTKSSAKELYPIFKNYLNGKPVHIKPYIAYVLTKHSQVKIILINNFYNKINDDGTTELLFSAIDVTELKKAEKELKDKEQRYRLLVETQVEAICRWLPDTTITFVNQAYCKFFGKNQKELLGTGWINLMPEDSRNMLIAKNTDIKLESSIREYELEIFGADGKKHWMQWTDIPLKDNSGMVTEFQSIGRDITKRKEAEVNLRKLSSAVVQSPVSIVISDVNGNIEYVNPKFTQVTGYSLSEVIGKNPKILKSGEQTQEFYKNLWETVLSGKIWKGEFHNKKKNGELFWESSVLSPILNTNGEITHFIAIKEDITEKIKLLNEIIIAKELAEQSSKLKDAFIANMSHEIRTPLNGIIGMTNLIKELLSNHISKDDEVFFDGIEVASKRIIGTVDTILNYSRLQVGEFTTEQKKINLVKVCGNLIKEHYFFANSKSLELTFENRTGMANILADEYSITQAISNLIDNAIKYTDEGFVKVTLYNSENNEILLDVSDSGIGIEKEYSNNIFEPYRQEDTGYNRKFEGVGLGLALVKKLLELNNCSISVQSTKGKGTTFTINLGSPLLLSGKNEVPAKTYNDLPTSSPKDNFIVLVVEDDKLNQFIIKNYINSKYTVLITDTSEKIIEILKSNSVDVILMDISIKGNKNGLEMAKEIKNIPEFSNLPIIATTAHAFEKDRKNSINHECDDFLPKPFTKTALLDTIEKCLKIKSN